MLNVLEEVDFSSTDRSAIGVSLLRASADHAMAVATLLDVSGTDLGVSAVVLARSNLDKFLRGVFFLFSATEEEISFYLKNNEMPSRQVDGSKRKLGPKLLAPLVADALELSDDRDRLIRMVDRYWGSMSDFTHGGVSMVSSYVTELGIGPEFSDEQLMPLLRNVSTVTTLGTAALLKASKFDLKQQQPMLKKLSEISEERAKRHPDGIRSHVNTGA